MVPMQRVLKYHLLLQVRLYNCGVLLTVRWSHVFLLYSIYFCYNLFLQELVKHTTDAKEKENLRIALDAMRVSVYVFLLTGCSYDLSIHLSCVSRTWRSVSMR